MRWEPVNHSAHWVERFTDTNWLKKLREAASVSEPYGILIMKRNGWSLLLFITHIRLPPLCVNDHICCQSLNEKHFISFVGSFLSPIAKTVPAARTHLSENIACHEACCHQVMEKWTVTTSSSDTDHSFDLFNYSFRNAVVLESIKSSSHVHIHGSG